MTRRHVTRFFPLPALLALACSAQPALGPRRGTGASTTPALASATPALGASRPDAPRPGAPSALDACPICGGRSTFVPYGAPPRPHAQCRHCGSLERHRLLYLYLQQKTRVFSAPLSLLHFAPERGLEKVLRAAPRLHYRTADLFAPADLKLDLTAIALPSASVDVLLCLHVLEHVINDRAAMREIYRVLRPGGWAILQVPLWQDRPRTYEDRAITDPRDREKHFGQKDHVRRYGWRDYRAALTKAGFEVTVDPFATSLGPVAIRRYRLDPHEELYVCRKPAPATRPAR